jgi:putative membrane protein
MKWNRNHLTLILKGAAMGIAEVIPGVSGGTIAFITGIYETLLSSIKNVLGPEAWMALRENGLFGWWKKINGIFLIFLITGMIGGLVIGIFGITFLLESYPLLLWSFFFGLILASSVYVGRKVPEWNLLTYVTLIIGFGIAFSLTFLQPGMGKENMWFVFLSGAIAISALILPGVSGSFILLLLGMYTIILPAAKSALTNFDPDSIQLLAFFGAGCLIGLALFSRVLSWAFKNHEGLTLALMTGFILGSLGKIWPWRNILTYRTNSKGESVPFLEKIVWPNVYEGEPMVVGCLVTVLLGISIVYLFGKIEKN